MNNTAHSDISRRIDTADKAITSCCLCPRNCRIDRTKGQKGYCLLDSRAFCFREMLHHHEESFLNPSHQIYFTGCNLRCNFCSVAEWNDPPIIEPKFRVNSLPDQIRLRRSEGAININILGGEPAVNLPAILRLLSQIPSETTVVFNTNTYFSPLVPDLLTGLIDIYLADLKCASPNCCRLLLDAEDYFSKAAANLISLTQNNQNVIIRHLLMPGHFDCCTKPVLSWIASNIKSAKLSIRDDYVPPFDSGNATSGYTTKHDSQKAFALAEKLGLNLVH